jgi:hypothetical protein
MNNYDQLKNNSNSGSSNYDSLSLKFEYYVDESKDLKIKGSPPQPTELKYDEPYNTDELKQVALITKTVASRQGRFNLAPLETPANLGTPLANGTFGSVYKVNLKGKDVVVKVAKLNEDMLLVIDNKPVMTKTMTGQLKQQHAVVEPTFLNDVREGEIRV